MRILILFVFLWYPANIRSDCCGRTTVNFRYNSSSDSCTTFGGNLPIVTSNTGPGSFGTAVIGDLLARKCQILVCGNGKIPTSGYYCGEGACNVFGCDCEGGCIPGKATEEFQRIHGEKITVSGQGILSALSNLESPCCVRLFEDKNFAGESIELCDCDEKCLNLPNEWRNRISSVALDNNNNLEVHSRLDCNGKMLKVPGAVGLLSPGHSCRKDFHDDGFFSGCSTSDLNDNSESIKILRKNAISSAVGLVVG